MVFTKSVSAAATSRELRLDDESATMRSPNVKCDLPWDDLSDLFMASVVASAVPTAFPL